MTSPLLPWCSRRAWLLSVVASAGAVARPAPASAVGAWPTQPVRFVVPFPAASAPDVLIRFVGMQLAQRWGQPVVVDNRPGGSGVIGMNHLLSSPTDGYSLGFVQGSAISVAPSLIRGVGYDFERDFLPVTLAAAAPFILAVPADSPYRTLADLLADARRRPEGVEVADNGRGTAPHLAAALLGLKAGVRFLHVHYTGGAQQMQATLGGQTRMMVETYNVIAGAVQGGKLRVLASMGDRVEPGLQNFPLAHQTVPGAVAHGLFAVIARKGVSATVLARLNRDMGAALRDPEVVAKSRELGIYPRPGTAAELAKTIADDRSTWQSVLNALHIQPE